MNIFDKMEEYGAEQITFFYDKELGLKVINCINNTAIGPAGGGTRFMNYATEEEALEDVLRLSRAMTYKNACAGLNMGGGKTAVIGDPEELKNDSVKREAFWRKYGKCIEALGGRYYPGTDVNTSFDEMMIIHKETDFIMAIPGEAEGDGHIATGLGVFSAMKAACRHVYDSDSLEGKTVLIQGAGGCGQLVCKYLHDSGAKILVADIDESKVEKVVKEFGAVRVELSEVYSTPCDIFSPNALGGTLNDETIPQLKCKIVCGSANNNLLDEEKHGKMAMERGIVCVPDFIANAGGAIFDMTNNVEGGIYAINAMKDVEKIYDRTLEILSRAEQTGRTPLDVAYEMARNRLSALKNVRTFYNRK